MHLFQSLVTSAAILGAATAAPYPFAGVAPYPLESMSAPEAFAALKKNALDALKGGTQQDIGRPGNCTIENAVVRKDWEHLCADERKDFIKAVQCLMDKPSIADPNFAKAAVSRYDDLTAVHVNLTNFIHGTGTFLTWHRYFVWTFETALRDECGYKGYMPYWNWFAHADDVYASSVFDGSDTSLGGDGAFYPHNGSAGFFGSVPLPPGAGGGCIESGPFKDLSTNMGPIQAGMYGMEPPVENINITNPRCVRRDLNPYISKSLFTTENLLNLTVGAASHSIKTFQDEFNGRPQDTPAFVGLHSAGHYTINGENTDFYTSCNDPAFYLHHAMIDAMFWIWQALHPKLANDISGTLTLQNKPPTPNATVNEPLIMGVNGKTRPVFEVQDTLGGTPLCYIYE